jgi:hypothetical protein
LKFTLQDDTKNKEFLFTYFHIYIFGSKRKEETGERRKLHNEELNNLYFLPNFFSGDKIVKNVTGGACSALGGEKRRVQGFVGET